jgi:hypothetical protein
VPTEFQNFWTIIKCVIAKMVSVGPPCMFNGLMNQPTKQCLTIKHLIVLVIFSDFKIAPYTVGKLVKKVFDQCNNECGVPFEKK